VTTIQMKIDALDASLMSRALEDLAEKSLTKKDLVDAVQANQLRERFARACLDALERDRECPEEEVEPNTH